MGRGGDTRPNHITPWFTHSKAQITRNRDGLLTLAQGSKLPGGLRKDSSRQKRSYHAHGWQSGREAEDRLCLISEENGPFHARQFVALQVEQR